MAFRFRGDRLYLVGRKSARGGKAVVTIDGRRRLVSFYSPRTRNRRFIVGPRLAKKKVHSVRIVNLGRGRHGTRVEIDAFGFLNG